jgi:hypothetical protein
MGFSKFFDYAVAPSYSSVLNFLMPVCLVQIKYGYNGSIAISARNFPKPGDVVAKIDNSDGVGDREDQPPTYLKCGLWCDPSYLPPVPAKIRAPHAEMLAALDRSRDLSRHGNKSSFLLSVEL